MPTYEYRCTNGHGFEDFVLKMSDGKPHAPCPTCGERGERQLSAGGGLLFKGSGFYITDYGKDGKKSSATGPASGSRSDGAKSESASAEGAKSDGAKSDSSKSDGAKSDGAKSDGAKSDGAKSDGAKSESAGAAGSKSESSKSHGAKSDGSKSERAPIAPVSPKRGSA